MIPQCLPRELGPRVLDAQCIPHNRDFRGDRMVLIRGQLEIGRGTEAFGERGDCIVTRRNPKAGLPNPDLLALIRERPKIIGDRTRNPTCQKDLRHRSAVVEDILRRAR